MSVRGLVFECKNEMQVKESKMECESHDRCHEIWGYATKIVFPFRHLSSLL